MQESGYRHSQQAALTMLQLCNRLRRVFFVLAGGLLLAGCFQSEKPLLDSAEGQLPIAPGLYDEEALDNDVWRKKVDGGAKFEIVQDRAYRISDLKGGAGSDIQFFELGDGFINKYVLQVITKQGPVEYYLAERDDDKLILFGVDCDVFKKSPSFKENEPDEVDGSKCIFRSRSKLLSALRAYVPSTTPLLRFVLKGHEPKATEFSVTSPRNAGSLLFELSVCNGWKRTVSYIAFYRHPHNERKWLLKGWWNVDPKKCHRINIPRGYFYISANDDEGKVWGAKDRYLCTDNRATERVVFENERCLVGEDKRGFIERFNTDDKFTISFTPPSP